MPSLRDSTSGGGSGLRWVLGLAPFPAVSPAWEGVSRDGALAALLLPWSSMSGTLVRGWKENKGCA